MASEQSDHLAEVLGAVQDRLRNPDLGLPTVRDICDALGALAKEPEGVTYAEVDAGGGSDFSRGPGIRLWRRKDLPSFSRVLHAPRMSLWPKTPYRFHPEY
jgi:hypothetical protein